MKNLTQESWIELISKDENAVIIDSRRPDEWENGIIEDALMMNIMDESSFKQKASQLDNTKNYYVYCRSGVRSVKACITLESLGFKTTYNLLGGILEWKGKTVIPNAY
ncbi:MAG: rhodanese-like domain-containing protein [Tamlana sp.]